jgi:hypothetical protein
MLMYDKSYPTHILEAIHVQITRCSRGSRHILIVWPTKQPPLKGCMWASYWPLASERFLSPSVSLTRTTSRAGYPPPRTVRRRPFPRLGYLLMPRRSSLAARPTNAPVLPGAAREASLVAFTCYIFDVACEFLVFLHNVVLPIIVPWNP